MGSISLFSQSKKRKVDHVTEEDFAIFEKAVEDVNYFTDWYCRTPTSGTRWTRINQVRDPEKEAAWAILYDLWNQDHRPKDVWEYDGITYTILFDNEKYPIFWVKHGWLWLPWQKDAFHDHRSNHTVIGGFGTGKTAYIAMSLVVLAAILPDFRGYAVAPQMIQANEVYRYIKQTCRNTPWWNRWVWNSPSRPHPQFTLRNDFIGESTIEILSIEKDPEKVRTLEGDIIFLDQAEKIMDLRGLKRDLGSRLRGTVNQRNRYNKMTLIANAGHNPQLWYEYHMAEKLPERYKSYNPKTFDNPFLSKKDIEELKLRIGGTQQDIDQWMNAKQPEGEGKHFPGSLVMACVDEGLQTIMNDMLTAKSNYQSGDDPWCLGFDQRRTEDADVVLWEMPRDPTREYCVIADPGSGNAPDRNAAVIMVWDITNFKRDGATLRAFNWVSGHGKYERFLSEYVRYVKDYRAQGRCAFDSTGVQEGFDELVFVTMGLAAEGMSSTGSSKWLSLNSLKLFLTQGLLHYPYIAHMVNQLTNYDFPDDNIPQDIVMAMAMSAAYIRRYFNVSPKSNDEDDPVVKTMMHSSRYGRSIANRHKRSKR